ncbi:Coiled-coil domain-containing protein, partial [Paragonimus heterotremus]
QSAKKNIKIYDTQTQYDAISTQLDIAQQKDAEYALEKAETELRIKRLSEEKVRLSEQLKRLIRERDVAVQMARKAEIGVQARKDAIKFSSAICQERKAALMAMKQLGQDKELFMKRNKLLKEIVGLQEALMQQCNLSDAERSRLQTSIQSQYQMNDELADLRVEVLELSRLVSIKADEREQKAREFRAATLRYARMQDELKTKGLQIQEHEKSLHGTQRHLRNFAQLYETIKEERNNCLTFIQLARQRMQESSEKMRVCTNELDILHNTLALKTEQIGKQRVKLNQAVTTRDSLRNELCKQAYLVRESELQSNQLERNIKCHNRIMEKCKHGLSEVQQAIGRVIQLRNERATQLVERNEELCVLQEKVRLQNDTRTKGEQELSLLDEQISWLNQEKMDLERKLSVIKGKIKNRWKLEDELTTKQIQLAVCQERVSKLESSSIDPKALVIDPETDKPFEVDPISKHKAGTTDHLHLSRVREVQTREPDQTQLRLKLDSIQVQLLIREKKLLEYNLLLQATNRLIEKLQHRAGQGCDTTLQLSKTMNEHQTEVNQTTKKLKAKTAELTMLMAMAFKLETEVEERRSQLLEGYRRLESGDPPSEEIRMEWERQLKREQKKLTSSQQNNKQDVDNWDSWTTAPERPNAYVLHTGDQAGDHEEHANQQPPSFNTLENRGPAPFTHAIPYGANAPFRPTEPGANMRHFRKPKLKELEL